MNKTRLLCWLLAFTLVFSGCSGTRNGQPLPTSTLPSDPEPTLEPDPVPDPVGEEYPTIVPTNGAKIPVTWAHLNLTGKLVYSLGAVDEENTYIIQIQTLDLVTGNVTVIYRAPKDAWIYYLSVSPDGKQLVMSYSPPLQSDPQVVQALYLMPFDGSGSPQLLFTPPTREDQYIQAEWSPDGKYIYYTYVNFLNPNDSSRAYPLYKIFRIQVAGGQPELIAEEAYWPRLSLDGSRLVYISLDPVTGEQHLKIAEPDGRNPQEVALSGAYVPHEKSSPFFSADGTSILFSGNVPGLSYQPSWLENVMGIQTAKAEGEPSDWWSVPVGGGDITRLTELQTPYLYGSLLPDRQHIVSYGGDEIFVMNADGSALTEIISGLHLFLGTVSGIP